MKEPSELDRIKLPDEPWVRVVELAARIPSDYSRKTWEEVWSMIVELAKKDRQARDALCALARCGASFAQIVRAAKEMEKP